MLLFLNIYHQKYFDLLDFIPRFVQTINLQIYYKHYEKTLLLLFVCLFVGISHAQAQVTVKGTVISSENNEPVIGASVLVKGTTNGTITDINGQFTLTNISPTNKTIIVSFIGMETQEVTIKPEMKIVMTSTTEVMEEVLVVAYGTAKNQLLQDLQNDSYRTNN